MFNKKPAWLRADLKGVRFKIPHSTCTNRYGAFPTSGTSKIDERKKLQNID
jgi:hypothetical protein